MTDGLRQGSEAIANTHNPEAALRHVIAFPRPALFLFQDLDREFSGNTAVVRRLRDTYRALKNTYKTIFLCGPELTVPLGSQKEVAVLDLPLPGLDELRTFFHEACQAQAGLQVELGEEEDAVIRATLGLTEQEARAAFNKLVLGRKTLGSEVLEKLYEEKRTIVRQEGILDYVPPQD